MRRWLAIAGLAMVTLPGAAGAYELVTNGTTLLRYEQRQVPGFDGQQLLPATQFVDAHLEQLGDGNLAAHLTGWGRVDLADQSDVSGKGATELTSAYLSYQFPTANAELKAGRFFLSAPGTMEQLDGISARSDLLARFEGLSLHLFGGRPVPIPRTSDNKGDYLAGGRLSYRYAPRLELGATILHESGAISSVTDPTTGLTRQLASNRQQAGGDLWFSLGPMLTVEGGLQYDLAGKGVAEESGRLTLRPHHRLSLMTSYDRRPVVAFFTASANPALFQPATGRDLRSYGASAAYTINDQAEVTADVRQIKRSGVGSGTRAGGDLRLTIRPRSLRGGIGYHRLAAPDGTISFHEMRAYLSYDPGPYQASIDIIGHHYDYPVYRNTSRLAVESTLSLGYRLRPGLLLSGDLTTSRSPQGGDELKGLLRLEYAHTTQKPGVGL